MSSVIKVLSLSLFPKRCRLCGEVICPDEIYCEECLSLKKITGSICEKCGLPKKYCSCSRDKFSPGYKGFCAPYEFSGSVIRAVYRLKNGGYTELAECFAERMVQTVKDRYPDVQFDAVTFVPMTRLRQRRRGYNQSEILARKVAQYYGVPCEALLEKHRRTASQRKLSAAARKANLYNAFRLLPQAAVNGKTVLLVDDVKTTGSTLGELAAILKMEGASVYAVSFAVVCRHKT